MPPVLETARLRLRPPTSGDLDAIYHLGANPRVMQYITGRTQTREEAKEDLEKRIRNSNHRFGYWLAEHKPSGKVVGWMALKPLEETNDIEIGYRFLEEFWGQGLATEGSERILHYAFFELDLPKVVAVAVEENRASTRVMEKLGMKYFQHGRFYNGICICYAVTKEEYLLKNRKNQIL
jgi:[ribosomal protein S5]-alanine N-acetyltransferase